MFRVFMINYPWKYNVQSSASSIHVKLNVTKINFDKTIFHQFKRLQVKVIRIWYKFIQISQKLKSKTPKNQIFLLQVRIIETWLIYNFYKRVGT